MNQGKDVSGRKESCEALGDPFPSTTGYEPVMENSDPQR
jgi:hypothetical protein